MKIWNRIALGISILLLCAVGAFLWQRAPAPQKIPVITQPTVDTSQLPLVLQGRSYCSLALPVRASMVGEVEDISVSVGQQVKKDDILLKLKLSVSDAAFLANRLNKLGAIQTLEVNAQKLEIQKAALERNITESEHLSALGMAPANALGELRSQLQLTINQIALAHTNLADARRAAADEVAVQSKALGYSLQLGSKPQSLFVRAPNGGHVIAIDASVQKGALVGGTAGGPLCVIGTMDPMIIRGQVHESELIRLQSSTNATIALDGGKGEAFEATLSRVSWAPLDANLAAPAYYLFELLVPNPEFKIKEGFKVQVTLPPLPKKSN